MIRRLLALITIVVGTVSFADETRDERFGAKADLAIGDKRDRIEDEIKELKAHSWAGKYYAGDGTGVNTTLSLAPKGGFVFEWRGCLGVYDRNYGPITEKDGKLSLDFTFPNSRKGFQGVAPVFTPIAWGERRYLVPSDEIIKFCSQVNQGSEPRDDMWGLYLLRMGDESKPVKSSPQVPAEFKEYLLAKPVEATITAVGETTRSATSGNAETKVTLDAGKKQGLRVGMELLVSDPDDLVQSLKLTKVDDNQSEALMMIFERTPKPGWRLSTRARWHPEKK